jgi:hypothetical protein
MKSLHDIKGHNATFLPVDDNFIGITHAILGQANIRVWSSFAILQGFSSSLSRTQHV